MTLPFRSAIEPILGSVYSKKLPTLMNATSRSGWPDMVPPITEVVEKT